MTALIATSATIPEVSRPKRRCTMNMAENRPKTAPEAPTVSVSQVSVSGQESQ